MMPQDYTPFPGRGTRSSSTSSSNTVVVDLESIQEDHGHCDCSQLPPVVQESAKHFVIAMGENSSKSDPHWFTGFGPPNVKSFASKHRSVFLSAWWYVRQVLYILANAIVIALHPIVIPVVWLIREVIRLYGIVRYLKILRVMGGCDAYYYYNSEISDRTQRCFFSGLTVSLSKDQLCQRLRTVVLPWKLRSSPVRILGYSYWIEDTEDVVENHVQEFEGSMCECANAVSSTDYSCPVMWTFFMCTDGILLRVHHALFDGVSCWRFMLCVLADNGTEIPISPSPKRSITLSSMFSSFYNICYILHRYFFVDLDQNALVKTEESGVRQVGWTEPIPLSKLKDVAKAHGATVNEVFMACTARAVQQLLPKNHDPSKEVRMVVCVSAHPREHFQRHDLHTLENELSYIRVPLAVTETNPSKRLLAMKEHSDKFKNGHQMYSLYMAQWYTPNVLPKFISKLFLEKKTFSLCSSCLPGPENPITIDGHPVKNVFTTGSSCYNAAGIWLELSRYASTVTISAGIDEAILRLNGQTVDRFLTSLMDELEALEWESGIHPPSTTMAPTIQEKKSDFSFATNLEFSFTRDLAHHRPSSTASSLDKDESSLGKDESSLDKDESSLDKDESSLDKDESSLDKDESSLGKEESSLDKDESSLDKDEQDKSSLDKDESSLDKDDSSLDKDESTLGKNESSLEKDESSLAKDESSLDKDESSLDKDESSLDKDESSLDKDESSLDKDESSLEKDESSLDKDDSSLDKDESSLDKDESSLEKDESSLEKDESSLDKDESSLGKDESSDLFLLSSDLFLLSSDLFLLSSDLFLLSSVDKDESSLDKDESSLDKNKSSLKTSRPFQDD
ncbi:unnamed protein product [Cyprideis torosa]|uniref:Uncharacterized protein n=1 Tax=Cyprideis torosa TaxID=163714 RepID=A0A7R8ZM86_9CRUS|nr:unnamed protein product [Cyprideis torosa]CAG0895001.1 unnamed protein product [Cyprideis torosa]